MYLNTYVRGIASCCSQSHSYIHLYVCSSHVYLLSDNALSLRRLLAIVNFLVCNLGDIFVIFIRNNITTIILKIFVRANSLVTKRITRSGFVKRYFGRNPLSIIRFITRLDFAFTDLLILRIFFAHWQKICFCHFVLLRWK